MIDWKNKPDGAERYHDTDGWLKCEGNVKSYHTIAGWLIYSNARVGLNAWDDATPDPSLQPETQPLQLTWNDAEPEATHILQNSDTSKQAFAVWSKGSFVKLNDRDAFYDMFRWFVVSSRAGGVQPETPSTVDSTINERGERYGKFNEGADIMQDLKNVMRLAPGWKRCTPSQREALEMIQHKIGRVLNGDPTYDDNWRDICGYSQLVLDELNGTKR
tara:strand:- start:4620 stop:5270 length:651 start_codon:yes stop_codon:yes gene_type:complete